MAKLTNREFTDEELDQLDPYAPDPCFRRDRKREYKYIERIIDDPHIIDRAVDSDTFWAQAAAFGVGPADTNHTVHVRYLDAIMALAARPPKVDKRLGPRNGKLQHTVGDTMRRKVGSET